MALPPQRPKGARTASGGAGSRGGLTGSWRVPLNPRFLSCGETARAGTPGQPRAPPRRHVTGFQRTSANGGAVPLSRPCSCAAARRSPGAVMGAERSSPVVTSQGPPWGTGCGALPSVAGVEGRRGAGREMLTSGRLLAAMK